MTRNTNKNIEIKEIVYPADRYLPEHTKYMAKLSLEIPSDGNENTVLTFRHIFDEREDAEQWAEKLDWMLGYGSVVVSRTYQL